MFRIFIHRRIAGLAFAGVIAVGGAASLAHKLAPTAKPVQSAVAQQLATPADINCVRGNFKNADGVSDGCFGAETTGSYQQASFFGTAPQSGQTYTTRPTWNVAGVHYKVGYDTTLTLKDPATAVLPSGCAHLSGGRSGISSFPTVDCSSASGFVMNRYDFSGAHSSGAAANGVLLLIESTVRGTCTITNNRFARGSNQRSNAFGSISLILVNSTTTGCVRRSDSTLQSARKRSPVTPLGRPSL